MGKGSIFLRELNVKAPLLKLKSNDIAL